MQENIGIEDNDFFVHDKPLPFHVFNLDLKKQSDRFAYQDFTGCN